VTVAPADGPRQATHGHFGAPKPGTEHVEIKTIRDIPLEGRKALIRADFNAPLSDKGQIKNDRRIRATLPTIKYALEHGAAVILMSHLGRPTGDLKKDAKLQMDTVAVRLADLLRRPVRKADQVVGPDVSRVAKALKPGEVFVLENLRFHPGEKNNDESLAAELAGVADVYLNDAFGSCHNLDASMVAVPKRFPPGQRGIGLLVERELQVLDSLIANPKQPMVALLGGAKVSDKIKLIERLIPRVHRLLIGGAMAYTFLASAGQNVGQSRVEKDKLDVARRLAEVAGAKLRLPVDHLVSSTSDAKGETKVVSADFPPGWFGMDIGPATIAAYQAVIAESATVVWNGPVGKFEDEPFRRGTRSIAEAMAQSKAITVVGGGETAEAVEQLRLQDAMTHVSTGGGAFLAYLAGERFESLEALT
jgi:phosphoglycerate kinase